MKYLITSTCLVLFLSGCTSATKPKINKLPQKPIQISATVENQNIGLKRLVAIGRFSDETKRSSSFLVDKNNNRLGKQTSDILSSRLTASGKFILLERSDTEIIDNEKIPDNVNKQKIGADYILLGSISEFGRETTSEVGIFSRNKIQKATATVNVRLVNVNTSEIIYSEEASGSATAEANRVFGVGETAAYNTALDDKAISAAISKLVANIMNNLLDTPWESFLLSKDNDTYIIAGGQSQGIGAGTKFNIYQPGKLIRNPQTNKFIELPGKNIAQIEVLLTSGKGDDEISITKVVSGNIEAQKMNQYRVREI